MYIYGNVFMIINVGRLILKLFIHDFYPINLLQLILCQGKGIK